jgi:RimJ/RimL family protein N-acetyltransferase
MSLIAGIPVISWIVRRGDCFAPGYGATGLGWVQGGKIVAGVMYEEFTEASIHATIVVEEPMTKGFVHKIFDYPFNQLGVDKIIVQANTSNAESVNLAKRLGFTEEGMIKGAYLDGDRIILTMTKDECRWLKELQNEISKDA